MKLAELLSYMRANDFSQVIAVKNERYIIVSAEGLAHWLEAKSKEEIIDLSETRLSDVIIFEPKDSCRYLALMTPSIGRGKFLLLTSAKGSSACS